MKDGEDVMRPGTRCPVVNIWHVVATLWIEDRIARHLSNRSLGGHSVLLLYYTTVNYF